ncbi:MAG TPA: lysylphosphatidylglycerol synthase domain-containing protein [Saprospiraceae bacterium]|nr:lysylphosphatidylglycerol synthase domain-containing protein [Saprospiraceae bacterium]
MFVLSSKVAWKKICRSRVLWVHRLLPAALAAGLLSELATQAPKDVSLSFAAGQSWLFLAGALALVPFNWWAEVEKWQSLMRRVVRLPAGTAWKSVLAGVAVSLFTPNRIGEYGGRILFLRPEDRWHAVGASALGNLAQALVLFSGGLTGALWLGRRLHWFGDRQLLVIALAALPVLGVLWGAYFRLPQTLDWLGQKNFVKRLKRLVKVESADWPAVMPPDLLRQLVWAALRYAVYCTQYFLLLQLFSIKIGFFTGFAGISVLFLLQTGIPLPPLSGLLARGNLAVAMWHQFGASASDSLAATFCLWIINLILPAFFGTFFLLSVRKTNNSSA